MKHTTGVSTTINPWNEKKNDLKKRIKEEDEKMLTLIDSVKPEEEAKLPEEEQAKRKQEHGNELAKLRANLRALKETLKEHRMNKNMSNFFEYHPHKGFNRSQARNFRKLMAKSRRK